MKTRSLSLYIVVTLALAMTLLPGLRRASADPQSREATYSAMLPYLSTPQTPPQLELVPFAQNFASDTITAIANAGDDRLFVVERWGRIMIVQADGTVPAQPFLSLKDEVEIENWEEGMMGLAFHPAYPQVPYFFVSYTPDGSHMQISRFTVDPGNANSALKSSEVVLMNIDKAGKKSQGNYRVHNAGDMHFGPDGYLYIAIGDGGPDPTSSGTSGDPDNRGQKKDELLAGLLRIDVNPDAAGLAPDCGSGFYSVPPDNPFADGPDGACDEVWSVGLRNPYRFSFDQLTGEMYIGEVGESRYEEIHYEPAGSPGGYNFGWACYEGTEPYKVVDPFICPPETSYAMPIYQYDQPVNCASVIGGYVYRGQETPSLFGRYLFADFCSRQLWLLSRTGPQSWSKSDAGSASFNVSTFGVDASGELYAGEWNIGGRPAIYRVQVVP